MLAIRAVSVVALLTIVFFMLFAPIASAQLSFPGLESSALINTEPARPAPGDRVHLSTQSVLLDLSNMMVTWKVNGTIIAEGVGLTEADFTAGPLGSVHEVVMSAYSNANTAYSTVTIVPTELDLIFEAATFVPPFFGGRALPTEQSKIRAEAVARFKRPNGSLISNDAITFTWWQNGSIVSTASGRGKSVATLSAPVLFGNDTVSVTASAEGGLYFASAMTTIPSSDPLILMYQDHPLFGVMYHKALGAETYIPEREMTFVASPYYTSVQSVDDRTLDYEWRVDGKIIPQDDVKRSALTINTGNQDARTVINLSLTQSTNTYFNAAGEWSVTFAQSGTSNGVGGNPFTGQR